MTSFRPIAPAAILGLCIAVGPALAGFFIYKALLETKRSNRFVTAKGLVERVEKADRGTWEISSRVSGNNLNQLYQKLSYDSKLIQDFIKKEGFDSYEISLTSPRVTDLHAREYGSGPLPSERYIIEYSVFVNSSKVDALNALSAKTGALISQDIPISRSEARYYLDKFNALRPELISEATKNAQEIAQSFAKTTGNAIGGIRQAHQGVIRMTSPDASPNQDYDEGINSLFKKIRVVSTLEFYLQ